MPSQVIQWFPGHMAKTKRLMAECLPQVDIVIELLDARIPASARNPEITKLVGDKPMLTLLTKAALARPCRQPKVAKLVWAKGRRLSFNRQHQRVRVR